MNINTEKLNTSEYWWDSIQKLCDKAGLDWRTVVSIKVDRTEEGRGITFEVADEPTNENVLCNLSFVDQK